ncbi:uncharacterized protein [Pyrus communis]|uniref:uncharacterized protein n=1 Tax=Pyrus communis TaxID=23211 RepID=UPI0035C09939
MTVNLIQGFHTKHQPKHAAPIGLYPDAKYLVIRIPDSRALVLVARSFILALCIVSLPWLHSLIPIATTSLREIISSSDMLNLELLPLIFRDLANEGLYKRGTHKAVFVSSGDEEAAKASQIFDNEDINEIELINSDKQRSIPENSIDFAFVSAFPAASKFVERTLKIGGIIVLQLSNDASNSFKKPDNYKMVYLRRLDTTVLAMGKTSTHATETSSSTTSSPRRRRLLAEEAKKEALKRLEDVLLEPPRAGSRKSRRYLKRTRFLPDLMGDSLESYPRRVFIDVGLPEKEGGSGTSWFAKNYPTRNKNFEMYKIETVTEESSGKEVVQTGMSEWLNKNVKEEKYVVMKAEAEVVDEMVKSKAIHLVDELFLECKPQGHNGKINVRSRRAYWQCLALYGQLRDEGVAVHQWWG